MFAKVDPWLIFLIHLAQRANEEPEKRCFNERFRAEAVLGKGSFGTVYKARQITGNQYFAVKVVTFPTNLTQQQATLSEIQTMKSLQHPNIVRYIDAWKELHTNNKEYLFVQMELCEQSSLDDWMNQWKQQNINVTYPMCSQMLKGLAYIHSKNIIHRDLKPGNIFVDAEHNLKIGDFGISKALGPIQAGGSSNALNTIGIGTPLFMPPEQMYNPSYTNKVDVYAMGLIIFALLLYYPEEKRIASIAQVKTGIWPGDFQTNFPNKFVLIKSMLDNNPFKRPSCDDAIPQFNL